MKAIWIVDDEVRQCIALANLLKNAYQEYEIRYFTRAVSVLEAAEIQCPDIIVTDIHMPEMDGLELISILCGRRKQLKAIVLSGYAEFEYARKALAFGTVDYLLKPLDYDKLIQAINRALRDIEQERIMLREQKRLREQLEEAQPVLEEQALNQLVMEGMTYTNCSLAENLLSECREVFLIALRLDCLSDPEEPVLQEEFDAVKSILREKLRRFGHSAVFSSSLQRNLVLAVVGGYPGTYKEALQDLELTRWVQTLDPMPGYTVTAAVGNGNEKFREELPKMYRELMDTLDYSFYLGSEGILYCTYIQERKISFDGISIAEEDFLRDAVKQNDLETAQNQMNMILNRITGRGYPNPEDMKQGICRFVRRLSQYFGECFSGMERQIFQQNAEKALLEPEDWEEFRKNAVNQITLLTESVHRDRSDRRNDLTCRFEEYLQEHYREDISLNDVADYFQLAPGYFSNLIKDLTGQGFLQNLTAYRMTAAKTYLRESTYKICEIAPLVGYRDIKYFNRVFKKLTGFTPDHYRKQFLQEAV